MRRIKMPRWEPEDRGLMAFVECSLALGGVMLRNCRMTRAQWTELRDMARAAVADGPSSPPAGEELEMRGKPE